jgi:signal peptide peptidase SppA
VPATDAILSRHLWLICPDALRAMAAQAGIFDPKAELPETLASDLLHIDDGVGVVSIHGPMLRRPGIIESILFGATDTEELIGAVEEAGRRDDVQALFLDIDSPGGAVNGTPELAAAVTEVSRKKYVYAFTAGEMLSAAYWVGSQADAIYATPSARVGSIGVVRVLVDSSERLKAEGLKVEVFAAGKFKGAGVPGVPLTGEQRDWLQAQVEEIAGDFRAAVLARGRKIPEEALEGQSFSARMAQRLNLAGVVRNREEAMARLRRLHVKPASVDTPSRAMSRTIEDELAEARQRITKLEADAGAREGLLTEAGRNTETLNARVGELEAANTALTTERDSVRTELTAAKASIQGLTNRNRELEAKEQDLEKRASARAARIVAETGTSAPARVSAAGEADSDATLADKFRAISDPREQTIFWRGLSARQQAALQKALSNAN